MKGLLTSFMSRARITYYEGSMDHDTQHNGTQHKGLTCDIVKTIRIEGHSAESCVLFIVMLSVMAPL